MLAKVRKAVFPAAGLGTRFLPATKAQPKEMLPIVDKPIIQYGVEEAIHSGIQNIIIVTGRGKTAIEDHFDVSFELEHLLEKPKASEAPSNLAIIGRYVLTAEIFESLQSIDPGSGGEIQLTDALRHLLRHRPIYAYRFEGTRYDAGDKLGFLKATVEFALRRHDLGGPFREYLKGLKL